MRIQKRLSAVLLTLLLSCALVLTTTLAYAAHPVVNMNATGNIHITMEHNGRPVGGGTLTIYKVASVVTGSGTTSGDYYFKIDDAFQGMGNIDLPDDMLIKEGYDLDGNNAALADAMRDYLNAHPEQKDKLYSETKNIDDNGEVTFEDLSVGLYLFVQDRHASGYQAINPFLVSIPHLENGEYVYDVANAFPKIEGGLDPNNPPPPTSRPEEPDNPSSNPASEPTSSEPTSSEPTSSQPESSEPTSSEPTSSQPESSQTGSQPAGGSTPGGTTPGGNTPGGNTPGGNTPGGTTPGGNTPGGGTTPGGGSSTPTLPQTGQLNWPIPVLVVAGLSLILVGWGVNYNSKSRKSHEA